MSGSTPPRMGIRDALTVVVVVGAVGGSKVAAVRAAEWRRPRFACSARGPCPPPDHQPDRPKACRRLLHHRLSSSLRLSRFEMLCSYPV